MSTKTNSPPRQWVAVEFIDSFGGKPAIALAGGELESGESFQNMYFVSLDSHSIYSISGVVLNGRGNTRGHLAKVGDQIVYYAHYDIDIASRTETIAVWREITSRVYKNWEISFSKTERYKGVSVKISTKHLPNCQG